MNSFLGSVVEPCLNVHVGSVTSNLVCLSSQFIDALSTKQNSEPCQILNYFADFFVGCLEDSWDCLGMFGNVWDIFGI